jgi:hypothetical protein
MNNSKWKKLFLTIFENNNIITECEIVDFFSGTYRFIKNKLENINYMDYIYSDCIDEKLITGEHTVSYREIEYIKFKKLKQDVEKTKEIITKTGKYEWEETEEHLRIYGYK